MMRKSSSPKVDICNKQKLEIMHLRVVDFFLKSNRYCLVCLG